MVSGSPFDCSADIAHTWTMNARAGMQEGPASERLGAFRVEQTECPAASGAAAQERVAGRRVVGTYVSFCLPETSRTDDETPGYWITDLWVRGHHVFDVFEAVRFDRAYEEIENGSFRMRGTYSDDFYETHFRVAIDDAPDPTVTLACDIPPEFVFSLPILGGLRDAGNYCDLLFPSAPYELVSIDGIPTAPVRRGSGPYWTTLLHDGAPESTSPFHGRTNVGRECQAEVIRAHRYDATPMPGFTGHPVIVDLARPDETVGRMYAPLFGPTATLIAGQDVYEIREEGSVSRHLVIVRQTRNGGWEMEQGLGTVRMDPLGTIGSLVRPDANGELVWENEALRLRVTYTDEVDIRNAECSPILGLMGPEGGPIEEPGTEGWRRFDFQRRDPGPQFRFSAWIPVDEWVVFENRPTDGAAGIIRFQGTIRITLPTGDGLLFGDWSGTIGHAQSLLEAGQVAGVVDLVSHPDGIRWSAEDRLEPRPFLDSALTLAAVATERGVQLDLGAPTGSPPVVVLNIDAALLPGYRFDQANGRGTPLDVRVTDLASPGRSVRATPVDGRDLASGTGIQVASSYGPTGVQLLLLLDHWSEKRVSVESAGNDRATPGLSPLLVVAACTGTMLLLRKPSR